MFVHLKQGVCLSVYEDDIKMAGKKQNRAPMWKKSTKNVDIDEPCEKIMHDVCCDLTSYETSRWLELKRAM